MIAATGGVLLASGVFFSFGHLVANVNRRAPADAIYVGAADRSVSVEFPEAGWANEN